MSEKKFIKPFDFILIIFLLILSAVLFYLPSFGDESKLILSVKVGKKVVYTVPLEKVKKSYIYSVPDKNVDIYIEPDGVSVKSSDCKNQICVKSGKITSAGQVIVCTPNNIIIKLEDSKNEMSGLVTG